MPSVTPSGRHRVGSITGELIDLSRASHLLSRSIGRQLLLKCWYPADPDANAEREPIWQQLRSDARTPLPVRIALAFLRRRTSTYAAANFADDVRDSRLIIYNHGLVSFASENTSLAEELASHGFTVIAIQHAEQLAELKALNASEPPGKRRNDARRAKALRQATQIERAKLAVEYYEASTNTNRIVVGRSVDTSFVLDHANDLLQQIPRSRPQSIDIASAHLVGFSIGGAVSTEAAKRDSRARSVVNLDGGMQGTQDRTRLRLPYLMMYSAVNDGINDELLPAQTQRTTPADTAHLNYHDIAGFGLGLRLLGAIGRVDPIAFLRHRNTIVREFCCAQAG